MSTDTPPLDGAPQASTQTSIDTTIGAGPRILHVNRSGLTFTHILDTDETTKLYVIETKGCSTKDAPSITIRRASDNIVVGTVDAYTLSKHMDLVVHEKPIRLEALSALSTSRAFTSVADPGRRLKWTFDNAVSHNLVCADEKEKKVASWEGSSAITGGKNCFKVEPEVEGNLLDEILVSGLAMVEHRAKRNRYGFGGAVASGLRVAGKDLVNSNTYQLLLLSSRSNQA